VTSFADLWWGCRLGAWLPLAVALAWVERFLAVGVLLPPSPALTDPLPGSGHGRGPCLELPWPSPGALPPVADPVAAPANLLQSLRQLPPWHARPHVRGWPVALSGSRKVSLEWATFVISPRSSPARCKPCHQSVLGPASKGRQTPCVLTLAPVLPMVAILRITPRSLSPLPFGIIFLEAIACLGSSG
jgi:hypothetical protein